MICEIGGSSAEEPVAKRSNGRRRAASPQIRELEEMKAPVKEAAAGYIKVGWLKASVAEARTVKEANLWNSIQLEKTTTEQHLDTTARWPGLLTQWPCRTWASMGSSLPFVICLRAQAQAHLQRLTKERSWV
ncbi:unnamed protein product [Arabis nemorensis]|uniref:Uncharacterized protein n=1 Tax=Arabis nemorensis TaxID=586526 RepID=A0A565AYS7_9BRAS|nr:unnamed protein product [Arabis nemorensis]